MGVHRPLGPACRARGVDHVGQPVRGGRAGGRRESARLAGAVRTGSEEDDGRADRRWRGARAREQGEQVLLDQEHLDRRRGQGVLQHEVQALARIGGVERDVGAPCLQDRQQPDHQLQRAFGADRHRYVRRHAQDPQPAGQPAGPALQAAIGQRFAGADHRHGIRRGRGLPPEPVMEQEILAQVLAGGVPLPELLRFGRGQQREVREPPLRRGQSGPEQDVEMPGHPLHARAVEEVRPVFQAAQESAVHHQPGEGQIELRGAAVHGEEFRGEPGKSGRHLRRVLQDDHDLEQRGEAQVARRLQLLHQLLERQVLVGIG